MLHRHRFFSNLHRLILVGILLSVASCASNRPDVREAAPDSEERQTQSQTSFAQNTTGAIDLRDLDQEMMAEGTGDPDARLVVSEARIRLETEQADSVHQNLMDRAVRLGGYVIESKNESTSIRVPATELHGLLAEIETWGVVSERQISGRDVTENFRDLLLKLANAEKLHERLLAMLEQPLELKQVLEVENSLRRVSEEIDRLKGALASVRHDLKFASVHLVTTTPHRPIRPGLIVAGVGHAVKGLVSLFVKR